MAKVYFGLFCLIGIGGGIIFLYAETYLSPTVRSIYTFVAVAFLILYFFEGFWRHPVRKTKAKVVRKSIIATGQGSDVTFLLPNGKAIKLDVSYGTYTMLRVGDDVILTYKGLEAFDVVILHKK